MYLLHIKCSTKHTSYKYSIQVKRTNKKRRMQSKDQTTIKKTKVMHVYISTTVLANDIHGDVLCQVKQVLMYKAECVYRPMCV